jgi:DNA-binding protein Fis
MTLTLTNQPTVEEVLSEAAPELPDADLKEEHLTNYVGFFVQTKDKCDYYIGLGLIKAHEQWAQNGGGDGSGSPGRFRAWCDNNKSLISSRQEAYRLMEWAKVGSVQNLDSAPEVIQQLEAALSKGARTELTKTEPIVQEAIINHVKETGESSTAKQVAELQATADQLRKELAAERVAHKNAVEEYSNQLDKEAVAQAELAESEVEKAELKKLMQLKLAELKKETEAAKKKAREEAALKSKIQKELDALKTTSDLVVVTQQSPEDIAETSRVRQNIVAKLERYFNTAAAEWREDVFSYFSFREYMTEDTKRIVDIAMRAAYMVMKENLDDQGFPLADQPQNTPNVIDI